MNQMFAAVALPLLSAVLTGCGAPALSSISKSFSSSLSIGHPTSFDVKGVGVCSQMQVNFGDGTPPQNLTNVDFNGTPTITHTYTGWGGPKTIKAEGITNCVGTVSTQVNLLPVFKVFGIAMNGNGLVCQFIPNIPAIRARTVLHTRAISDVVGDNAEIAFGCAFNGCHYDLRGANIAAGPSYPFPTLRKWSMVFRIGTQTEQGPTTLTDAATFIARQAGGLELCVNGTDLWNASGGWGVRVSADEPAP